MTCGSPGQDMDMTAWWLNFVCNSYYVLLLLGNRDSMYYSVNLDRLTSRYKTTHESAETEYFWETLMEILWMVDLKSYFEFHNKDIPVPVCLLAVWFSFKQSALFHTVSATNIVQFSVCVCVIFCQPDVRSLACLSNSLSWMCFTCLSASCCFSPGLPPCLLPARANRRDEESGDQSNTCGNAARCTLTPKYCCNSRYQTANISPPN